LQTITNVYGSIDKQAARQAGCTIEAGDRWLAYDADILIPAALEAQITQDNVRQISDRVKIVAEAANGPTTIEADQTLTAGEVFLIPDFLCNAGGVTVSYFESVQNDMNYYWSSEEVLSRLDTKMTSAFQSVLEVAQQQGVHMREAAYMVAIDRVVRAMQLRGWA
jgi:glutamate dehydrogenase